MRRFDSTLKGVLQIARYLIDLIRVGISSWV